MVRQSFRSAQSRERISVSPIIIASNNIIISVDLDIYNYIEVDISVAFSIFLQITGTIGNLSWETKKILTLCLRQINKFLEIYAWLK